MLKIAIVEDERECQEALIEHLRKYEKEKNEALSRHIADGSCGRLLVLLII